MHEAEPGIETADSRTLAGLRRAIDTSHDVVFMTDGNGTITFVNGAFEQVYGYRASDVVGRTTPRILKGGRAPADYPTFWQRLLEGQTVHADFVNRTSTGRLVHVRATVGPILDAGGQISGFLAVQRPLTDAPLTDAVPQDLVLQTEHQLSPDAILVVNAQGAASFFNDRFAAMWGVSAHAPRSGRLEDLLSTASGRGAVLETFLTRINTADGDRAGEVREELIWPDGRRIEARSAPMYDSHGAYHGRVTFFRDTTSAWQTEAALRRSQQHLQMISDHIQDLVSQVTLQGIFEYVSPSHQSVLGYAVADLLGTSAFDVVHPDDLARVRLAVDDAIRRRRSERFEFRARHADGHYRWLEALGTLLVGKDHRPVGAVLSARDVTDRRDMEAQLLQAQKMEVMGRLAGGVAHDFNNLLTSILGYTELVMGTLEAADRRREDMLEIQRAGQSAVALTRQLLTFSRRTATEVASVDLNGAVQEFQKIVSRTVGEDVSVTLRLAPTPLYAHIDRGYLEQVVMNLCVNARDAMPHGGRIEIATEVRVLDQPERAVRECVPPGAYLALSVRDTGGGMTPDVLAHVCEPFFTTKAVGKGTGLGLSTVHRLVKSSGGYLAIASDIDAGTTVTVFLPAAEAQPPAEGHDEPLPVGHETVLVVDDDDGIRALVAKVLSGCGYRVVVARDATEARRCAATHAEPVDLLVTDVIMPGTGGPELARELGGDRPNMRVLYMSGHHPDLTAPYAVSDACFLAKPFSARALTHAVRDALRAVRPAS